jgi:hypothetical protein
VRYSKRRLDSSANERCREEVIADQVYNALNTDLISELSRRILVYPIAGIRKKFQSILHLFGLGVCWT